MIEIAQFTTGKIGLYVESQMYKRLKQMSLLRSGIEQLINHCQHRISY